MKAFSAIALAMVPDLIKKGLKRPIHFALSYDEEIGCFGAPSMIDRLLTDIAKPSAVIVGEPTSMRPIVAHKGIAALRTTDIGYEPHSSQVKRGFTPALHPANLIAFPLGTRAETKTKTEHHNRRTT